jgi:hypothetical protein
MIYEILEIDPEGAEREELLARCAAILDEMENISGYRSHALWHEYRSLYYRVLQIEKNRANRAVE